MKPNVFKRMKALAVISIYGATVSRVNQKTVNLPNWPRQNALKIGQIVLIACDIPFFAATNSLGAAAANAKTAGQRHED